MNSPLVFTPNHRPQGQPEVGHFVTWVDFAGRNIGGRITRKAGETFIVKVCGLVDQSPYSIGEQYPVGADKIIDWGI